MSDDGLSMPTSNTSFTEYRVFTLTKFKSIAISHFGLQNALIMANHSITEKIVRLANRTSSLPQRNANGSKSPIFGDMSSA